ncbi:MAG: DNA polymerase III subunit gamma/tau [Bacillota bacterium]
MYKALYRIWRPQKFSDVVGQQHIVKTLLNSMILEKISHAYLFVGPRGTGKTSIAKIFAKAINCRNTNKGEPCCQCDNCLAITEGSCMDVYEMDAASNRGIDEIRDIIERVKFQPSEGKFKVYIVDEVHMLTTEAFNALLKTLEEPPSYVVFILCTTDVQKVPATILSRCQRYDFGRIAISDLTEYLRLVASVSGIKIDEDALTLICEHAAGGARDALSTLDQCSIMSDNQVDEETVRTLLGLSDKSLLAKLLTAILVHDIGEIITILDNTEVSQDIRQLFADLLKYAQEQMHMAVKTNDKHLALRLSELIINGSATISETRWSLSPRLIIEAALIKMALDERPPMTKKTTEKSAETSVIKETKVESKVAETQKAIIKPADIVTDTVIIDEPPVLLESGDGAQVLWDKVLSELRRMNKRLVIECAKNGRILYSKGANTVIAFSKNGVFFKERLEKDDYRKQVEIALQNITGNETALAFVIEEEPLSAPPKPTRIDQFSEFFGVEVKNI